MATETIKRTSVKSAFENALTNLLPDLRQASEVISGNGLFTNYFTGKTKSGQVVNHQTALTLSGIFNGVEIISNDIAKLSKFVFKKDKDGRTKLDQHPLDNIISLEPNNFQTAFMFWKTSIVTTILKGNFYALINRNPFTSEAQSLFMLDSDQVKPIEFKGEIYYKYKGKTYHSDDIFHIPGFSFNGITGLSIIQFAARSLGVALSSQEFSAEYYEGKGTGSGIITTPANIDLNSTGKTKVSKAVTDVLTTITPWRIPVLDEGMKFTPLKISAEESAFIKTNKFGVEEIARWLNLPVHKIKSLDNATNNNIEHQSLEHVEDSIHPWAIKYEQEARRKLFTDKEKRTSHFIRFNLSSLIRADFKTRGEYLSRMVLSGIMTRNEARLLEDMNKLEGLDDPLTPVNVFTPELIKQKLKDNEKK